MQEEFRDIFGTWGFIKKSRFQQKWYRVVVQVQDHEIAKEIAKADFRRWDKHLSNGIQDTNLTFSIISTRGMHSSNVYPCPYIPPPQGGKHARFWDIGFINGNNSDFIEINAFRYNLPKKPEEHLHCLLLFLRFLHKRDRINFKKLFGFDVHSTFKFEDCYQKDSDFIQAFKRIGIKFRKETNWSIDKTEKNVNAFLKHYTNSFKNSLGEVSLNKVTKQLSVYLSKQKGTLEGHVSQDDNELVLTSYNGSPEVRKHIVMNVIGASPKGSIANMSPQFSTNRDDHDNMGIVSRHPTFGTLSSTPSSPVKRKY